MTQKSGTEMHRRAAHPGTGACGGGGADLVAALGKVKLGDPAAADTRMGPLASKAQFDDVRAGIGRLASHPRKSPAAEASPPGSGATSWRRRSWWPATPTGRFSTPTRSSDRWRACFLLSGSAEEAAAPVALGGGGTGGQRLLNSSEWAERIVLDLAFWHGRLWLGSDRMAEQSLPPGMVLPASIHGGPGRAGGGEELGGLRGLAFYQQRTALQGFKSQVAAFAPPEAAAAR
ncbi:MAG: hypothetical protein IPK67_19880 [Planctomycetes bacterium]|nr:hypothetical protein [Planctomycetota bacterium]